MPSSASLLSLLPDSGARRLRLARANVVSDERSAALLKDLASTVSCYHANMMSAGLCQRRHWPEPRYHVTRGSQGFQCTVRVNNREYQTPRIQTTESIAREEAALIAFNICRSFSANDGMYPTGFAHDGVIQGNPVPVGSGRHGSARHGGRHDSRGSNSSLDRSEYHYTSDSVGSRSGGSSPDYVSRRHEPVIRSSRYGSNTMPPSRHAPPQYNRHGSRHY